jgi:spermidine synthase
VNAGVALVTTWLFAAPPRVRMRLRLLALAALLLLGAGLLGARAYESRLDAKMFADPVVLVEQTPYQRIALTHRGEDTRLFLDGNLQLSSLDEYRYHEALVHPALARAAARKRVLVLGGGDGMAAREILRWPEVEALTLVDLDPAMTRLFRERPELAALNARSLHDPRVQVVNDDAAGWVETWEGPPWDVVIVDFPDPNHLALGKLYSTWFYGNLRRVLAPGAWIAVQSTSPFYSPDAYWCIARTLSHAGFTTWPYHVWVPSFGDWGFILAHVDEAGDPSSGGAPSWEGAAAFPEGLRFLDAENLPALFSFPPDMGPREVPVNRLDNQALVQLYARDWRDRDHR